MNDFCKNLWIELVSVLCIKNKINAASLDRVILSGGVLYYGRDIEWSNKEHFEIDSS